MKIAISRPEEIQHIRNVLNEIKAGFEAIELLREFDKNLSPNHTHTVDYDGQIHNKIKNILSKVTIHNEVS